MSLPSPCGGDTSTGEPGGFEGHQQNNLYHATFVHVSAQTVNSEFQEGGLRRPVYTGGVCAHSPAPFSINDICQRIPELTDLALTPFTDDSRLMLSTWGYYRPWS